MLDTSLSILRSFQPHIKDIPLNERARLAAEIIHKYRSVGQSPVTDSILGCLHLHDDDVGPIYKELYRRPLHLNRVPQLQESEFNLFFDSSETGVTDTQLYYLRSMRIVELRILGGNLYVSKTDWETYRDRNNGFVSLTRGANMLKVSRPYLRSLIREGVLPAVRPQDHDSGNMYQIAVSDIEALKPKLEWVNLAEAARRYDITRERARQILGSHTLSAHINIRQAHHRKKTRHHWKRIRKPHEVLVRVIDFERHFQNNNS